MRSFWRWPERVACREPSCVQTRRHEEKNRMSRRTFLRHIHTRSLDDALLARYLLRCDPRSLYECPEQFPRLCSQELFGNDAPLELEVGCGSAEFLCALAAKEPAANFVGVDIAHKPLEKAVEIAASLALANLRLLKGNFAQMYPLLEPCSLRRVYVHFPDPNMRPRFRHRRVISPAFLDAIHRALAPGGTLSVMTDHTAFFLEMLALLEADCRFEKTHAERYLVGFEPEVKSRFQLVWERHGLPILRCELRKRSCSMGG
jgi:tRNA (guanine-N7-)-methyltransferase